jgi:hypothetical protein
MPRLAKAALVTGLILLVLASNCLAYHRVLPTNYRRYAAALAREGISFASVRKDARLAVTVTCDSDLLKHLRSLQGFGLPTVKQDLVEKAPDAVALFYALILTHGYLRRLYDQTEADDVNVQIRFASSRKGQAGEIIGSITMDREKADAVDWSHVDPGYLFSYSPSASTVALSQEVQQFNQSSGYSLPLLAHPALSGSSDEATSWSAKQLYALGLGLLIALALSRLIRVPVEAPDSVQNGPSGTAARSATLSNHFRKDLASVYTWLQVPDSAPDSSASLQHKDEISNPRMEPWQPSEAEDASIAGAGPADDGSERNGVEDW